MSFVIVPYMGVGPIRLGMTRDEVRRALDVPVEESYKTAQSKLTDDIFDSLGITISYRLPGACDFIEFHGLASPTFRGGSFLGKPFHVVQHWFQDVDPDVALTEVGLRSYTFGISIYAPAAMDEPDEPVEAVSIFEKGLYDHFL